MKIHVGTSGFAYKEWKEKFYPKTIPLREMLCFYSGHLRAVEINNTFYHMPMPHVLTAWAAEVPNDFVFTFKAPQIITHIKRLRNVNSETAYLFRSLAVLQHKLGMVLFQFPKSFHADRPVLEAFLDLLPSPESCAFEFRSSSWVEDEIADLLRERGFSLCIEDTDENPADDIMSTGARGYLRLRRYHYTDDQLAEWAEKILSQKWEKVFVFFKHEDEAKGPKMAMQFQKLIDLKLNARTRKKQSRKPAA